jgi:hypothetical protein
LIKSDCYWPLLAAASAERENQSLDLIAMDYISII